jgi:hypothetical protein
MVVVVGGGGGDWGGHVKRMNKWIACEIAQ